MPFVRQREPGRQNRGSALLLTLLVIATLTALTLGFSRESGTELELAGLWRDAYRAYHLSRSGMSLAVSLLREDPEQGLDSLKENWADPEHLVLPETLEPGLSLTTQVVDECGKLNLNALVNEAGEIDLEREAQLKRLFKVLGLQEEMLAPLLDWLDRDQEERPGGAEDSFYQGLERPYRCGNRPFATLGQVALVKGYPRGLQDLSRFLTIYSDGTVNVHTAPKEVLLSLSEGMDDSTAEAILQYRLEGNFLSLEDLRKVPGVDEGLFAELSPYLSLKSSAFSVTAQGQCHGAYSCLRGVFVREGGMVKTVYWQVG
ncbi:MAG: type II secretion system minor pseudopilin GspK [Deltaproteobacteria bacterium]|nr:type II secretion system minor pseudopilin GspK [Deltaproteobacteria bacterium]